MKLPLHSITFRLTATLGIIALVVFTVVGALLHRGLAQELRRAGEDELVGKVEVVRHFVGEARDSGDMQALRHHLDDVLIGHRGLRMWLIAADGAPWYGGTLPNVLHRTPENGLLELQGEDDVPMQGLRLVIAEGESLRIAEALLALDSRPRQRSLTKYRNLIVLICTLGVTLAIGFGALAAWRGLGRVKKLSIEAYRIAPASLSVRLSQRDADAELLDLTRAFNGVLDRLESAYRQMDAFNADVAHELRTPLATMISGAQLALRGTRPAGELREALGAILEELEDLAKMVNDMLLLARADQGERAQGRETTSLRNEAAKAIDYCEVLLDEAGVHVDLLGDSVAACNPPLVRRAVSNLLSNAIRHSPRGATISVSLEALPGRAQVSVLNPGALIPEAVAQRMFDRFFRGGEAYARSGANYGLGLSIVRAVARMHAGDVFADRQPNGNRVGFWIASS